MLTNICHSLETSSDGDKAVYTMLIGAGFSYGVIPTAKQILQDAPSWLHKQKHAGKDQETVNKDSICKEFWKTVSEQYSPGKDQPKIEFQEGNYFPKDSSITDAYKLLMSGDCPGGLTTPGLRREYIRNLHKSAIKKNNPAHLYLACLLNQQRKMGGAWKYKSSFCRTILTTNFDPLLQDALQLVNVLYYMSDRPEVLDYLQEDDYDAIHLVYTHGSMHRYLLLNAPEEIHRGTKNSVSLKTHFERHGVIVIGYGGWQDATMEALSQATQFDGNLYWCARKGDTLSEDVQQLLKKHAGYAYKVVIPDADEAMHTIFKTLTDSACAELLDDPIALLIEQIQGLSVSESKSTESTKSSGYIDSFNSNLSNTITRLNLARAAYRNPEIYNRKTSSDDTYVDMKAQAVTSSQAVASKYMSQALTLAKDNNLTEAIDLWSKVLDILDVPAKQKAKALINRGVTYGKMKPPRTENEIADYTAVIEMPDAPAEQKAKALLNRGITYGEELKPPKIKESIADYTAVVEMPHATAKQRAGALLNRGAAYGKMEPPRIEESIADYTAVIEMPDVPAEQKAGALFNRGTTYAWLESPRIEEAITDYTTVVDMPDAPAEQKSTAHGNLGLLLFEEKDDITLLLEETTKALEYDSTHYEWRFNLGLAKLFLGIPDESLELCSSAINECTDIDQIDDALKLLRRKESLLPEKSKTAYEQIIQALNKRRTELEH